MTANYSDNTSTWRTTAKILLFAALGLCGTFIAAWSVLEALRWIGARIFIDASIGSYVRLDVNEVINVFPNNLLVLSYLFGLSSVLPSAWRAFHLPRWCTRYTVETRRAQAKQDIKRLVMVTLVLFLLCLPGMNTYTIVTPSAVVQKRFFALHAQTYPLKSVTRVQCVVIGRGLIFTELTFTDGRSLEEAGFPRHLMAAIAKEGGTVVEYDSRCQSEFNTDERVRPSAQVGRVVNPGGSASVSQPMQADTEYVAEVAFYRDVSGTPAWRRVVTKKTLSPDAPLRVELVDTDVVIAGDAPKERPAQ
ncbi:type VI secretion lipofamily protein [Ralstonia insidiosa]|uniref:Type VI secretion lipofamily protein n=1 Tax=Ralstonia insidiosa TaxID=190721 RepID=A0AAC9BN28_9RALS|nr:MULTISPECIES: type VI secretion lipoprotein TssJ [Ralstonia]ANH75603.1 type VI secretion lipofamily protein [Ralstonia insidiosa]